MMTVIDANLLPLLIALLVGLAVGVWIFRRLRPRREGLTGEGAGIAAEPPRRTFDPVSAKTAAPAEPAPSRARPIRDGIDTPEGRSLADEGAAAFKDVAGQVLGVDAHPEGLAASGPPDDLQMLKGVGPKLAQKLNENGIFRFAQLAALSANEVALLDGRMGAFRGRLDRDRIVEQASYLARGDRDGFEARFGKLGSGS